MTRYVAIYARLSPRPDGSYEGVDLQTKWGHAYAAERWPGVPVRVFPDAGISAANDDHRPQFEALRDAISRGEVAHLWAVEQTRLERREVEWFRLAAEMDAAGIGELHTNRDGIVRVRDEVAGIKAVLAASEVRKLKRRVNDRLDEIAAEGRPPGAVVFGYRHGVDEAGRKTLLVDETQAAAIRESAARILAGWSMARIAADLHARGLRGAHGGRIHPMTVRKMVTNHTVAGWRVHRGRVIGRGVWTPILDEDLWNAVRDKLAAPRIVERIDGGTYPFSGRVASTARRWLLIGGLAVCAVCAAPLTAGTRRRGVSYYTCHRKTGGRGCVAIMAERLEQHVVATLLDELDKPAFRQALAEDEHAGRRDEITAALRALEGKRRQLATEWATADDMTGDEWRAARAALDDRERTLRADLAAVPPPAVDLDVTGLRDGWTAMNLDERRQIIGMFIERVTVKRARPGATAFDPGRIAIEWRTA